MRAQRYARVCDGLGVGVQVALGGDDRLIDALMAPAFAALNASPGARAYYDSLRAPGIDHNDALRRLANRLVGILHDASRPAASMTRSPPGLTVPVNLRA